MNFTKNEKEIENKGIEFSLNVDKIPDKMYDDLLAQMIMYVYQSTRKKPKYIGEWEIIIKAKDIEFERG